MQIVNGYAEPLSQIVELFFGDISVFVLDRVQFFNNQAQPFRPKSCLFAILLSEASVP